MRLLVTQGRVFLDLRCLTLCSTMAIFLKGLAQSLHPLLLFMEIYRHQALLGPELPHSHPVGKSRTEAQTTQSSTPASSNPVSQEAQNFCMYYIIQNNKNRKNAFFLHLTSEWEITIDSSRIRKPRSSRVKMGLVDAGGTS